MSEDTTEPQNPPTRDTWEDPLGPTWDEPATDQRSATWAETDTEAA